MELPTHSSRQRAHLFPCCNLHRYHMNQANRTTDYDLTLVKDGDSYTFANSSFWPDCAPLLPTDFPSC